MIPFLDLPDAEPTKPKRKRSDHLARVTDPQPSKDAAKADSFGPACQRVLATLIEIERTGGDGANSAAISMRMSYDSEPVPERSSIARRLTSLHRKGYVTDSGERRDGGHGVLTTVYRSTPEGRTWLEAS